MARSMMLAVFTLAFVGLVADAAIVQRTFRIGSTSTNMLCRSTSIIAVNNQMPGPTLVAHEGDTVIIHVINNSPHVISIHWHGIFQLLSGWADGANLITQCPIWSGSSYTYKFDVVGQEGTLWWHAHSSFLRATVYGALIIRPRLGPLAYPFDKPYGEIPIILGEWWKEDVIKVEKDAYLAGNVPIKSDAFTINGMPGDLYPCPNTYKVKVEYGKTYMLRIINAALNSHLFFKVAGHFFTVVAADASYTEPCVTDTIVIAPGQTVDALMEMNAAPGRYYMAAHAYLFLAPPLEFDDTTATAVIEYALAPPISSAPDMPPMPFYFDTPTAELFYTRLNGLVGRPGLPTVPLTVDERMFVTVGFNLLPCAQDQTRCGAVALAASMSSIVFQFPKRVSLLEAHFKGLPGIYTSNFPDNPPVIFDYTKGGNPFQASKGTELKKIRYNAVVEVVLQNTAIVGFENHPIHLHGFNFFVLAQGAGNYDSRAGNASFNLVNPLVRNTIAVPAGGWAVIRFVANNPGVWFMHCHMDSHLPLGLAMAFEVENGNTPDSILPPPPPDYPKC